MKTVPRAALFTSLLYLSFNLSFIHAHDTNDAVKSAERIGSVEFPVACSPAAQKEFNRAMALFHSFWFKPAIKSFEQVLQTDAKCGMAYWGIGFMSMGNPFAWPPNPKAMETAAAAVEKAKEVGVNSEREWAYIAAFDELFKNQETAEFKVRLLAFQEAMEEVAARYPDDQEAQILYALILSATAPPTDKTYANQQKAADILEHIYKKAPDHPGVVHYLVHTYDNAGLAERGLKSARAYSDIAPSVPHALHMPSHIYARVGLWKEMVEGDRRSYLAAKQELADKTMGVGTYDALHAMDYMVYGQLQLAQDKAAKELVDEIAAIKKVNVENFVAAYALAAIPTRYAIERNNWKQAARLELSPRDLAWEKFPQAEAVLVYGRALGKARTLDLEGARQDVLRLLELKNAMLAAKAAYWSGQTDIQMKTVNAWIALAEKREDDALQLMQTAADAEDATDKHPVTPGNVIPARELLGEMLLAVDRPQQAQTQFERSLAHNPNRYRGLYGAAKAAALAGDTSNAQQYQEKLAALSEDRDTDRPELARFSSNQGSQGK